MADVSLLDINVCLDFKYYQLPAVQRMFLPKQCAEISNYVNKRIKYITCTIFMLFLLVYVKNV